MNKTTIFTLNRLADELEAKAKAYRMVASDLMNGHAEATPKSLKGKRYKPGTHWTQKPENRARVSKIARLMHKAKREQG